MKTAVGCIRSGVLIALISLTSSMAWAQPSEALVFDSIGRDLYHVDLITGDRTLLSGSRWDGVKYVLVEDEDTALVYDDRRGVLERVILSTGVIETVSGPDRGTGPELTNLVGLTLRDEDSALAATTRDEILQIDLSTGDRTALSSHSVGVGPPIRHISAIAMDSVTPALLATIHNSGRPPDVEWPDGLYRVDLSTGDWSPVILGSPAPEDEPPPDFLQPREILPGPPGEYAFIEAITPAVTQLFVSSELIHRTELIIEDEGQPILVPVAAVRTDPFQFLILDQYLEAIYRVDLPSGQRTLISRHGERGAGPSLDWPRDMALAPSGDELWIVAGGTSQALLSVDIASGDRTLLQAPVVGAGFPLEIPPSDVVRRANGNVLALANAGKLLCEIDRSTGAVTSLMDLEFPVTRMTAGAGTGKVWAMRDQREVIEIDFLDQTVSVILPLDGPLPTPIRDLLATGPTSLFLLTNDGLWEVNPQATTPEALMLAEFFSLEFPDRLAALSENDLLFTALSEEDLPPTPAIFGFRGGEPDIVEVSSALVGVGPPLANPRQFEVDEVGRIWLVDNTLTNPSLMRIDAINGGRTVISGPGRGAGPLWRAATTLMLLDGQPLPDELAPIVDHLTGRAPLPPDRAEALDLDGSGELDVADLIQILGP